MKDKLLKIQTELKSPKSQRNEFGKYNYRSCEDILESVKPLLLKYECCLTLDDEIIEVGGRVYVKSIATIMDINSNALSDKMDYIQSSAYAREAEIQKGMSEPQITGSASSYARKYALNGLFLIDDTRDDDATNTHDKEPKREKEHGNQKAILEAINKKTSIKELDSVIQKRTEYSWTESELKEQNELIEKIRAFITEAK
jgi:hypothetical protein